MLAKDMITDVVPPLKTSDTGQQALNMMEVFRISHLPIVNNDVFLGLISESDIYDLNEAEEPIGNHKLSFARPYVYQSQHIYEVIELGSRLKLSIVPVLDEKDNYVGMITMHDITGYLADLLSLKHPGAIIVLELTPNNYTLSEIARIIEGNDAKILSLYIKSSDESSRFELTLKVNKTEITSIISAFERYNYQIKAFYSEQSDLTDLYNERYDLLMKYLNI